MDMGSLLGLGNLDLNIDFDKSFDLVKKILDSYDFSYLFNDITLEKILFKGYIESGEIDVLGVKVILRTLLINEQIMCWEKAAEYKSPEASQIAYRIEYLVYSIVKLNNVPLTMDLLSKQRFKEIHGREPTAVEEARYVIKNNMPSFFIDILFLIAMKFKTQFEEWFFSRMDGYIKEHQEKIKQVITGESSEEEEVSISDEEREAFR